jgi:hypothetical protein
LGASCLSFLSDHALDSILDARDLPVKDEADELKYFFFAVFNL